MMQTNTLILLATIFISLGFSSLDENGKVHLKVSNEENGEISVFGKIYANMEALDSDEELRDFDDLVKDRANNNSKGIFIKKRIDPNAGLTWVTDEDENNPENGMHMVIKKKTGIDEFTAVETEKIMVFKTRTYKESDVKQTININIEEENGEELIEINIKRTRNQRVKISQNLKEDDSLDGIDYFVKNDLNPSQLNYYPNPNHGRFNLKFSLKSKEEVTIKIMDILGNEVYKEKILDFQGDYDNQIDLSGKEKGLYILQIHQKKKMFTRKILIE